MRRPTSRSCATRASCPANRAEALLAYLLQVRSRSSSVDDVTLNRRLGPLAGVGLVALLAGCSASSNAAAKDGQLTVVTTVAPITSIAASVIGDRARVVGVVPEGTNSHTFDPPPKTAQVMEQADVVFVNGLKLEDPTYDLAKQNSKPSADIVQIGTKVLPESNYIYDFSFPKKDGKPNPHLWTDPLYAIKYADVIRDEMVKADPRHASSYDANHDAFVQKATALSDALKKDQATIPGGKKELLTYHDAYAYFGKDYDWTIIG